MLKKLLQFVVFITAFMVGFLGIFSSIFLYEVSNPENYTAAIADSGVVKTVVRELDVYATELYDKSQQNNSELEQNQFGPRLMYRVYQEFRTQIDMELLLNLTIEQNLENITDWMKGKRDNIYIFVPKSYLIANIDNAQLKDAIVNVFTEEIDKLMADLPLCTSEQENNILAQLETDFNPEVVTCRSAAIKSKIRSIISERLPIQEKNLMEEILNANLGDIKDETKLSKIGPAPSQGSPKEFNQDLQNIQWYIKIARIVGIGLILFSLILALILYLSLEKPRKVWKPATIYLSIGVLLLLVWLVIDLLASKGLAVLIQRVSADVDKLQTEVDILSILQDFISTLAANLTSSFLVVGILLTIASTAVIIISYIRKPAADTKIL